MKEAKIAIVMGSRTDFNIVLRALEQLKEMNIPYVVYLASAHRSPQRLGSWVKKMEQEGAEVIIAAAGGAAHLPGVIASQTLLPVIGVPLDTTHLRGIDALYSIVQMPRGVPVATVGVNNVENAVLLALHILGLKYPDYKEKLAAYRQQWESKIEQDWQEIRAEHTPGEPAAEKTAQNLSAQLKADYEEYARILRQEIRATGGAPAPAAAEKQGPETEDTAKPEEATHKPEPMPERPKPAKEKPVIHKVDPESPDPFIIEEAMDVILNGGIVAFPTDTVYGIAVDATNAAAVKKLYQVKQREKNKAIPLLIHTQRLLRNLVKEIPEEAGPVMECFWPGSLTIVFAKYAQTFQEVSPAESIGIRIPDNLTTLSLISMVGRPLATTSANISGQEPATSAEEVKHHFGNKVDLILDGGTTTTRKVSTVLSLIPRPFEILREGTITREELARILGDKLK